ncbi:MAG: M1 family metallopeptidase [Acidimicrobiia bacterium]|nr:M1 family metallopeptidase [Acidimicrobiia bacterium]
MWARSLAVMLVLGACTQTTPVEQTNEIPATNAPTTEIPATTLALQAIEAADGIGDDYYPNLGNAGYDVQHVTLDLTIDPSIPRIEGVATFEIVATVDLASWSVDLVMFPSEVVVDGVPAEFDQTGGEVRVTPTEPIRSGSLFTMTMSYSGTPVPYVSIGAPFTTGFLRATDSWFGLSEPDGASSWFPSNDHPLDKATYTVKASVPAPMVVASSGRLISTESLDTGFLTYTWESAEPLAPYLLAFAVGDFERVESETASGVAVRDYYDEDLPESAKAPFARQVAMIEYLEGLFGPYPFEEYGALVLDTQDLSAALETQTLSTFGRQALPLGEDVVVHELAHQWFGDSVSVARWQDIWLNEGFATYTQWLWIEHGSGVAARDVRIVQAYELMSGRSFLSQGVSESAAAQIAATQFPPPGTPPVDDLFNAAVYLRGGLALHDLRQETGDDVFFEVLREFHRRFAYGNATTDDFIEVAEDVSGTELTAFFEAWLYEAVMPPIEELGLSPLGS